MQQYVFPFLQDEALEERVGSSHGSNLEYTGKKIHRVVLILDCLVPHDFSPHQVPLLNLQHYVIREKKLSEKEAVVIFFDIVRVVENLHKASSVSMYPQTGFDVYHIFIYMYNLLRCITSKGVN